MQLLLGLLFLIGVPVAAAAITIGGIALIRRERETIHGSCPLSVARCPTRPSTSNEQRNNG